MIDREREKALRKQAERIVQDNGNSRYVAGADLPPLIQELEVRQVELDLQNEELKQIHEQTERLLHQYTELYDNAPVGYLSLSRDGVIDLLNLAAARIIGSERETLVGQSVFSYISPNTQTELREFLTAALEGKVGSCELTLHTHDGSGRRVRLISQPAHSKGHCGFAMLDVTESWKAGLALRQSEDKFSSVFRNSPVGMALAAFEDERYFDANDSFLEMFGLKRDELLGHTATELNMWISDKLREEIFAEIERNGYVNNKVTEFRRRTGETGHGLVSLIMLRIADRQCVLCVVSDISERFKMQQRMLERDEVYRAAIETTGDGFLVLDANCRVLDTNESYLHLSGYSREELIDMSYAMLDDKYDELRGTDRYRDMTFQSNLVRKDGVPVPVEISKSYRDIGDGRCFLFVRDISERLRMEREAQLNRSRMEELVNRQVAAQTAAAFGHELNQPLGAISAYSDAVTLMLEDGVTDAAKFARAIHGINEQAQRAGDTLHELLTLLYKSDEDRERVDLNELMMEALEIARHDGLEDFSPELHLQKDLPPVQANRIQMQKVMVNLLCNGVEAMRAGGIDAGTARIILSSCVEKDMVVVSVEDSGPGISTEILKQIFEPFFTTKDSGMGLGLSISRSLVEEHHGRLWAESSDGGGAIFHVALPVYDET